MTLFLKKNGRLLTPALHHGVLPGTFRAGLLERGLAYEAGLTRQDLETADEIFVGNSVRGLVRGRLMSAEQAQEDDDRNEAAMKVRVGTG